MALDPYQVYEKSDTENALEQNKAMLRRQAEEDLLALEEERKIQPNFETQQTAQSSANIRQDKMLMGKYKMTQAFGNYNPEIEKYSGGINYGADFATPEDTPIALPSGNWTIEEATQGDFNRGYGNSVLAVNQDTGEKLRFSHLNRLNVNPRQNLQGNSVVGYTGNTGNSTGPHIDIEYYTRSGKPADILASSYAKELF